VFDVGFDNEALMSIGPSRSSASLPAARTATTPAAGGSPGGKLGMGQRPLLIAMTHRVPNPAAASVAGPRSLRRKPVEFAMAISGTRSKLACRPGKLLFLCSSGNRKSCEASGLNGLRIAVHFQYDSNKRHGLEPRRVTGNPVQPIAYSAVRVARTDDEPF
jgi:hypothetical protein